MGLILPARVRKVVLTAHVATSVGWLGAVIAYLVLDVTAVAGSSVEVVRASYVAMEQVVRYAIVPLALASVLVGVVNGLVSPWGLVRYYWVLVKLLLTVFATAVLLVETATVGGLARAASEGGADPRGLPGTLAHSIGGLVVLLMATILSVFKPRGLTRYGWRRQQQQRREVHAARR